MINYVEINDSTIIVITEITYIIKYPKKLSIYFKGAKDLDITFNDNQTRDKVYNYIKESIRLTQSTDGTGN